MEQRARETLLESVPELGPLFEGVEPRFDLRETRDVIDLAARGFAGLTRAVLLIAREVDRLRSEIDGHDS